MVTEVMENYRNEEAGQSSLVLAKAPVVIENHRDYHGRKLWTYLARIKQLRGVRSHIVNSVPNSSALKKISSLNWLPYYLKTRICRSKLVGITSTCKRFKVLFCCWLCLCFQNNAKHKNTSQVSIVFHDEFVRSVQCYSIKCGKRNHKYCVSSTVRFGP